MKEELVNFKGINGGIYIVIKEGDFDVIKKQLRKRLNESADFFKGAHIMGIKGEELSKKETNEIIDIIKDILKPTILNFNREEDKEEKVFTGIHEGMTKFINTTIRSGQVVEYDGNVVIIGDVNPGAIIEAKGNIIVLGRLKGVAHAGIDGNTQAIIASYDLQPSQLRISNIYSRKPDGNSFSTGLPEVAKINNDEVIIQPYLPRKY